MANAHLRDEEDIRKGIARADFVRKGVCRFSALLVLLGAEMDHSGQVMANFIADHVRLEIEAL